MSLLPLASAALSPTSHPSRVAMECTPSCGLNNWSSLCVHNEVLLNFWDILSSEEMSLIIARLVIPMDRNVFISSMFSSKKKCQKVRKEELERRLTDKKAERQNERGSLWKLLS